MIDLDFMVEILPWWRYTSFEFIAAAVQVELDLEDKFDGLCVVLTVHLTPSPSQVPFADFFLSAPGMRTLWQTKSLTPPWDPIGRGVIPRGNGFLAARSGRDIPANEDYITADSGLRITRGTARCAAWMVDAIVAEGVTW